jgi:hypothetical protein
MNRDFQFVVVTKCSLFAFHFQQGSATAEQLGSTELSLSIVDVAGAHTVA